MSQTRDQQRFTISEVAADWHEHCPRRPLITQVQHWAKMAQTEHVTL